MYAIAFEPEQRILHLRLEGFWTREVLQGFAAELLGQVNAIQPRDGKFALLSDSRDFAVQSAGVADGFTRIMTEGSKRHNGPVAIVVGSMLNKVQAERSMPEKRIRAFLDPEEARAWLIETMAGMGWRVTGAGTR